MAKLTRSTAKVGDKLPIHTQGPITRTTLALFAGASNDHTPFHIDTDYAKAAGMDDVIAHGMLSMAYLGQLLTQLVPQQSLRTWTVRFKAITPVHATVKCTGEILDIFNAGTETHAKLHIYAVIDGDILTLDGEAVVALE